MSFLYHLVPENMQGYILYPLNKLKEKYPEMYKEEVKKYKDREELLKTEIPILDCKWNDVLHFTAVHPSDIRDALREVGFRPSKMLWFYANPEEFDTKLTIIYGYNQETSDSWLNINNFERYDPSKISEYSRLPESTKKYYRKEFESHRRPLLFVGIPHILCKSNLNIKNAPTIEA